MSAISYGENCHDIGLLYMGGPGWRKVCTESTVPQEDNHVEDKYNSGAHYLFYEPATSAMDWAYPNFPSRKDLPPDFVKCEECQSCQLGARL